MGKKIAIISQKGGVGKTTTVVNLGYCLADEGKKVLLIDMDPLRSMTCVLGMEDRPFGIAELLQYTMTRTPLPPKSEYVVTVNGVDCIPCSDELSVIAQRMVNIPKFEKVFHKTIAGLVSGYDYIIVDCGSRLDLLNVMVIATVDSLIIPVVPDKPSIYGLTTLMATILRTKKAVNQNLEIDGILLTMVESRTNLTKILTDYVEREFGQFLHVFKARIPRSITANEALGQGHSVSHYQKRNPAAVAYKEFAKEVLELGS